MRGTVIDCSMMPASLRRNPPNGFFDLSRPPAPISTSTTGEALASDHMASGQTRVEWYPDECQMGSIVIRE